MPRGPNGETRPRDSIATAVKVMRIATGEEEDRLPSAQHRAAAQARADSLTQEQRQAIAKKASQAALAKRSSA